MLAISEYFKENNLKVSFADSMTKDDNFASFKRQFNPSQKKLQAVKFARKRRLERS